MFLLLMANSAAQRLYSSAAQAPLALMSSFRSLSVCIRLISKLCLYDEELCILLGMYM